MTEGRPLNILPMAITRADETHACVGALTAEGTWVRPEPVTLDDVAGSTSAWRYRHWTRAVLAPPVVDDPRPEDRALKGEAELAGPWSASRCREFADRYVDATVSEALSGYRSLGMVYARLHRVYVRRATRGREFVRFVFSDATGEEFDWIVPDIAASIPLRAQVRDGQLPGPVAERTREVLQQHGPLLLALGLTRPNNRFPGKFRGCHPLVVGVHPAPAGATVPAADPFARAAASPTRAASAGTASR
jgi:hypothetical protein